MTHRGSLNQIQRRQLAVDTVQLLDSRSIHQAESGPIAGANDHHLRSFVIDSCQTLMLQSCRQAISG
jgi:hypothetical protein